MALAKAALERMQAQSNGQRLLVKQPTPPLENGDRLTRAEFERRYRAMPSHLKAELIEGVVYMSSPVRHQKHGKPHRRMVALLSNYSDLTPGTDCSDNATVLLDQANEPQPDISLFIESAAGGQARINADDYIVGAPELAVEIAASTVSLDMHDKLKAYFRNGVREYIVWRVKDGQLDWFVLQDGQYVRLTPDTKGIICSQAFPGLWLNVKAMLKGEMKEVRASFAQGLASKEHAAFVKHLKAQRRRKAK